MAESELRHRYSGSASWNFWKKVNALPEEVRKEVYLRGCELQNLEEEVLEALGVRKRRAKR